MQNQEENNFSYYLAGNSPAVQGFRAQLALLAKTPRNLCLFGEVGCGVSFLAQWLHQHKALPTTQFMEINLDNYTGADYEMHIWASLKEVYNADNIYGTLLLRGIEKKDILFVISLLEWFYEHHKNKALTVIISFSNLELFKSIIKDFENKYVFMALLPLRERLADLWPTVSVILNELQSNYSQKIAAFSHEFMEFVFNYNWPGNMDELRYNLELLFLAADQQQQLVAEINNQFINS